MSVSRKDWSALSSLARQRSLEDEEERQRERRRRHRNLSSTTEEDEAQRLTQNGGRTLSQRLPSVEESEPSTPPPQASKDEDEDFQAILRTRRERRQRREVVEAVQAPIQERLRAEDDRDGSGPGQEPLVPKKELEAPPRRRLSQERWGPWVKEEESLTRRDPGEGKKVAPEKTLASQKTSVSEKTSAFEKKLVSEATSTSEKMPTAVAEKRSSSEKRWTERTSVSEKTPAPEKTSMPEKTSVSEKTPAREQTATPEKTSTSEKTLVPEKIAASEKRPISEKKSVLGKTSISEKTLAPEKSSSPERRLVSEKASIFEKTITTETKSTFKKAVVSSEQPQAQEQQASEGAQPTTREQRGILPEKSPLPSAEPREQGESDSPAMASCFQPFTLQVKIPSKEEDTDVTSPTQLTYSSSLKRSSSRTISFRMSPRKDNSETTFTRSASVRLPSSTVKLGEKLERYHTAVQRSASIKSPGSSRTEFLVTPVGVASKRHLFEKGLPSQSQAEPASSRKENLRLSGVVTSKLNLWISRTQESGEQDPQEVLKESTTTKRTQWRKTSNSPLDAEV
ncbi:ladinin-1 [Rhynchocyon petersi]